MNIVSFEINYEMDLFIFYKYGNMKIKINKMVFF